MSERARKFFGKWVDENFHPVGYEDEDELTESKQNAAALLAAAKGEGITTAEFEEEYGNLVACFARMQERYIDREIENKD